VEWDGMTPTGGSQIPSFHPIPQLLSGFG